MTLTILLFISGLAVLGLVVAVRAWEAEEWKTSLVRYRLWLPRELSGKDLAAWLAQIGAQTVPPRFSLLQAWPVCIEIEANHQGITHTVMAPRGREVALLASLRACLPGVRVEQLTKIEKVPRFRVGASLRLTSHLRPLGDERAAVAANGVLAAMQPLPYGAAVRLQLLLAGVRARKERGNETDGLAWLLGSTPDERGLVRDQARKRRAPLLVATARIAVAGPSQGHAYGVLHRIVAAIRVLEAPGAHFLWRVMPSWAVRWAISRRQIPLLAWPLSVNTLEAVGLVSFPIGQVALPGLRLGSSRQVPPSPDMPRNKGVIIGESTYPGARQKLGLLARDRLMHSYVLGPPGVGKSTLLANMALQDIAAGHGAIVIDPKNDLIEDLLARIPEHRLPDVILLDAANSSRPLGFNPMRVHGGEHARELAAETTVHILRSIFKEYWGPRTDDILRAALFSLTQVPAPNGTAFTMCEVAELLTNSGLRRYVMRSPALDERWRAYWQEYDTRGEAEQLNMVGAVLNKLRAFTHRTSLRLVLGQSEGLDISEIFTKRKVLLVPLSEGQIGSEASVLLGSLLVGALWSATLQRSVIPVERRQPVYCFLDEFQSVVRISDDLADMLAKARGLGLSLTLAHQYVKQLPEAIRAAALGATRTQIFFQTDYEDSQLIGKRLAPVLTADDLLGLPAHEAIARLCVHGQTRAPVSLRTFPLPEAIREPSVLRRELAQAHGTPRAEVEAALVARSQPVRRGRAERFGEIPLDGGDE